MTVEDLMAYCQEHWARSGRSCSGDVSAAARAAGRDPEAGRRRAVLGIPTVLDRMIQQALHQVLTADLRSDVLRTRATASVRGAARMDAVERARAHIARVTGGWWTWTSRSSLTV